MKNRKIGKAAAAVMAALTVSCNTIVPAFALENRNMSAAMVQPSVTNLTSGKANKTWRDCIGEKVDKYNLWPGCEYIMRTLVNKYIWVYEPVRVIDRYEEEHKFLWIPYTRTVANIYRVDWKDTKTDICDEQDFYYSTEPFPQED